MTPISVKSSPATFCAATHGGACKSGSIRGPTGLDRRHRHRHSSPRRPTHPIRSSSTIADGAPGIFEERIYRAKDGRTFAGVNKRFNDHTTRIFAQHGITPVGFWTVEIGADQPSLYYLLRFDDLADYDPKWGAFRADPEWQQVRAESEKDGNLLLRIRSTILAPTPFSPMR